MEEISIAVQGKGETHSERIVVGHVPNHAQTEGFSQPQPEASHRQDATGGQPAQPADADEAEGVLSKKPRMKKGKKNDHGTHQWADITINCCTGCSHGCVYCYAKQMATRFGWAIAEKWTQCTIRPDDVIRRQRLYPGTVMFPSSHDITLENYEACRTVLGNLLAVGNQVLIVSKPHLTVIQALCEEFKAFQAQMEFRFTIGAMDNGILSVFEPFAPSFEERRDSLAHAFSLGFRTSVSIEPMLDPEHIHDLVAGLMPFVSETIWIGKLNYVGRIPRDNPAVVEAVAKLRDAQSDDNIFAIYQQLKDLPMIRWKTSVKKVVGKVVGIDSPEAAVLNA